MCNACNTGSVRDQQGVVHKVAYPPDHNAPLWIALIAAIFIIGAPLAVFAMALAVG